MSFIFAETPGMYGAAAAHEGLAMETGTAGGAQAAAAGGMAVPPGLEDVSAGVVAKVKVWTANATAVLAEAAGLQSMYGASVVSAGVVHDVADEVSAIPFTGIA